MSDARSRLFVVFAGAFAVTVAIGANGALPWASTPSTDARLLSPVSRTHMEGFAFDPMARLGELHAQMIEDDLPLVRVAVASSNPARNSVELRQTGIEWDPGTSGDEGASPSLQPLKSVTVALSTSELASVNESAATVEGLLVADHEGVVVALAFMSMGRFLDLNVSDPTGPLFLADAGRALVASQYDPNPDIACGGGALESAIYSNEATAIVAFFQRSSEALTANVPDVDAAIEQLVTANPGLVDPVTGRQVSPSRNDLMRQLTGGISLDEVIIRPALPIGITVAGDAGKPGQLAVFVASPSGEVLGWTHLEPDYAYADQGEQTADETTRIPITTRVVELAPPPQGEALAVYVRHVDDSWATCGPMPDEPIALLVPFADYAGGTRAWLDLSLMSYRRVTELP